MRLIQGQMAFAAHARVSAAFMIAGLVGCLLGGYMPTIALIFVVQGAMVRELFALAVETRKEKDLPWFRLQQWYFYGCAVFFSYGRYLNARLAARFGETYADDDASGGRGAVAATFESVLLKLLAHHGLISYLGWTLGCVLFVLSLRKGLYLYQFGQFAWTHMIIAAVIVQSSCLVGNVLEGLIWFVFPVGIVFFNDVAAYLVGMICGRTPLIKISPKRRGRGSSEAPGDHDGRAVRGGVASEVPMAHVPQWFGTELTGGPDLGARCARAKRMASAPRAVDLSVGRRRWTPRSGGRCPPDRWSASRRGSRRCSGAPDRGSCSTCPRSRRTRSCSRRSRR